MNINHKKFYTLLLTFNIIIFQTKQHCCLLTVQFYVKWSHFLIWIKKCRVIHYSFYAWTAFYLTRPSIVLTYVCYAYADIYQNFWNDEWCRRVMDNNLTTIIYSTAIHTYPNKFKRWINPSKITFYFLNAVFYSFRLQIDIFITHSLL